MIVRSISGGSDVMLLTRAYDHAASMHTAVATPTTISQVVGLERKRHPELLIRRCHHAHEVHYRAQASCWSGNELPDEGLHLTYLTALLTSEHLACFQACEITCGSPTSIFIDCLDSDSRTTSSYSSSNLLEQWQHN